MPAAFAHYLFGRLVYRKLDPGIRRAVRREKDCFYLGLFGPDILFFYRSLNDNRIVHKGFWLHEEPGPHVKCRIFLKRPDFPEQRSLPRA